MLTVLRPSAYRVAGPIFAGKRSSNKEKSRRALGDTVSDWAAMESERIASHTDSNVLNH